MSIVIEFFPTLFAPIISHVSQQFIQQLSVILLHSSNPIIDCSHSFSDKSVRQKNACFEYAVFFAVCFVIEN